VTIIYLLRRQKLGRLIINPSSVAAFIALEPSECSSEHAFIEIHASLRQINSN